MSSMSNSTEIPLFAIYPNNLAAIIIFLVSTVGVFSNSIVAFFTGKLSTMSNPYGRLTASQSTGEVIICSIFAFYFSPMVFFDIEWMKAHSKNFGFIALCCYDICIWSHLFISINRLVAIIFPTHYQNVFSLRNTRILILFSWLISIGTAIVLYKMHDCDLVYAPQFWAFVFSQTDICAYISWYIDFYKDISIVFIIAIVDTITIFYVHQLSKKTSTDSNTQANRQKREINFLKQAVLQGVVFTFELFTYFVFAWKFENRWIIWTLTTFSWNIVHTSDAIIIITFNREFRQLILHPLKLKESSYQNSNGNNQPRVGPVNSR